MITVRSEVMDDGVSILPGAVEQFVKRVLSDHGIREAAVTVIFATDDLVRKLKREFLHQDEVTDVLAFRLDENETQAGETKAAPLEGEIYISPETARENAKEYGVTVGNELGRLIFHGCLHLLGYRDDTSASRSKMREMENVLLSQVSPDELLAP